MDISTQVEQVESEKEYGEGSKAIYKKCRAEISNYDQKFKAWNDLYKKINQRYASKTKNGKLVTSSGRQKKYNILWSNIETVKSMYYSRTPIPVVSRRNYNNDSLARKTGLVLENAISYEMECYSFDDVMKSTVLSALIGGRGVAMVDYVPEFEVVEQPVIDEMTGYPILNEDGQQVFEKAEVLKSEKAITKVVNYNDFGHTSGRNWEEVRAVWFKAYLTREELIEKFPEVGKKVKLTLAPDFLDNDKDDDTCKKAVVYTYWDKTLKKVHYLADGYDDLLKSIDDPWKLTNFFPCPKPIYTTLDGESLEPTPDYILYQDQAAELDMIVTRKAALVEDIKLIALRDGALEVLDQLITRGEDGDVIPVPNWRATVANGGLDAAIWFYPIKEKIVALEVLTRSQQDVIQQIYEITGFSDIVRGASNPNETATAQQIKGNYANLRLGERQKETQRFAKDLIAIKGELICELFQPDTILKASGYEYTDNANPEEFQQIVSILKDDASFNYRVEIETDSTIAVDESVEKEKRTEYLNAVGEFMAKMLPMTQQVPMLAPFITETIKFVSKAFIKGRSLEETLEQGLNQFTQGLMQPPPPPPDPMQNPEVQYKFKELENKTREVGIKELEAQTRSQQAQASYDLDMAKLIIERDKLALDLEQQYAQATQSQQNETIENIAPEAQPVRQEPINLNVNIAQPVKKKVVTMMRDPLTGSLSGTVEEVA